MATQRGLDALKTPAQVRQYVRNVMVAMLESELLYDAHLNPREGWMFGGLESPDDDKDIAAIGAEVRRVIKRLSR